MRDNVIATPRGHVALNLDVLCVFSDRHVTAWRERYVIDIICNMLCTTPTKNHGITANDSSKCRIRGFKETLTFFDDDLHFVLIRAHSNFGNYSVVQIVSLLRKSCGEATDVLLDSVWAFVGMCLKLELDSMFISFSLSCTGVDALKVPLISFVVVFWKRSAMASISSSTVSVWSSNRSLNHPWRDDAVRRAALEFVGVANTADAGSKARVEAMNANFMTTN